MYFLDKILIKIVNRQKFAKKTELKKNNAYIFLKLNLLTITHISPVFLSFFYQYISGFPEFIKIYQALLVYQIHHNGKCDTRKISLHVIRDEDT